MSSCYENSPPRHKHIYVAIFNNISKEIDERLLPLTDIVVGTYLFLKKSSFTFFPVVSRFDYLILSLYFINLWYYYIDISIFLLNSL